MLLFACLGSFSAPAAPLELAEPLPAVWQMLARVDPERAAADFRLLSGVEPLCGAAGCVKILERPTGSAGLSLAKDYVAGQLAGQGFSVARQDWSKAGYSDQNLVARKPGARLPGETITFVAHLDGVSGSPAADDNASGVVALLELARALNGCSLSRTLVLLVTTGEEQGTLGAQSYLEQLPEQELQSIRYAINLDMLGYDANGDGAMELWHGGHPASSGLASLLAGLIETYQLELAPELATGCG
jgi:acetylornithine deacetylase/succinyl-diaminopimelate desuccinylase-like protein